jgi:phosphoribosylanthranilate isomerase
MEEARLIRYPSPARIIGQALIFPSPKAGALIKICGITHPADAEAAIALGADALGINFYPGSPRFIDRLAAAGWLRSLGKAVPRIGVTVNLPRAEIDALWGDNLVDALQLHGDEDEAYCMSLREAGIPFIKAIRLRDESVLLSPERFATPYFLLDAYRADAFGGTGQLANWALAREFAAARQPGVRTILSGGLTPGNVGAAIREVRPFAVDVASGVEGADGPRRKDAARLRDFFAAAREAAANLAAP